MNASGDREGLSNLPDPADTHPDFIDGYLDGRDPNSPEPSANRSHRYRHSFAVGRAELANKPIPVSTSVPAADEAERKDQAA